MANTIMTVIPLPSPFLITPIFNSLNPKPTTKPIFTKIGAHPYRKATTKRPLSLSSSPSPSSSFQTETEEALSIAALQSFINLNLGNWLGSFYQFNPTGEMLNKVATKLAVSSYGEYDLSSLIQTLYIKQPPSSTGSSGDDDEPEWVEYKIKETNIFAVDKYHQAFVLRYQTAGMLETVKTRGSW